MLKLSERLLGLRKEHKLTQTDAAKAVGVSLKSYCRYESGERVPDASILVQIADFYGVSADYLLGRSDDRA